MAESQRKVELQEPDDIRYLLTNIRRAANSKIDEALPAIEGEDALRTKVIELVHQVGPHPPIFLPSSPRRGARLTYLLWT